MGSIVMSFSHPISGLEKKQIINKGNFLRVKGNFVKLKGVVWLVI
jgi:hypothetical protein